ncbi:MAG: ABC transporter ATP-binding protein [Frankiaceae bacterium]|nr:ABC transporter ATP-binding protein [Frankiaceae bacterium]
MSLQVQGLHAGYGRLEVLHGVDLEVGTGELVAVIGANGAGKTTLLRALSGLLKVRDGTVLVNGTDVTGKGPEKLAASGLAHVPENRLVFPTLTVADNLLLGAYTRRRRPSAERDADRERALALFPRLADRLGQAAGTLSGGEQQMLAVARGLMARPTVLMLDEPSVGLAPRLVGEIFTALGVLRDDGLTLVLIEQNARAALAIADRGYVMDRGRVVFTGVPSELLGDARVQATYLGGDFSPAGGAGDGEPRPAGGSVAMEGG